KQDEVVYDNPCESPEELKVIDCVVGLQDDKNLEVKELRRQCQQLEPKQGRICAERASLRSRKKTHEPQEESPLALPCCCGGRDIITPLIPFRGALSTDSGNVGIWKALG
ncbi:hypothetical protein H8959_016709, partial [Pygathrix nigripes]